MENVRCAYGGTSVSPSSSAAKSVRNCAGGVVAHERKMLGGNAVQESRRSADGVEPDEERHRQEHSEEDELQQVGLDHRPRPTERGVENDHSHPDDHRGHGGHVEGGVDDGADGQGLGAEDAGAQDDGQYAGDQSRRPAVVGLHDVAEGVGADVVLESGRDEVADEHRLNAERAEGEHVHVSVTHGAPATPSDAPPPRKAAARLPKKTGQMIRLPATAKSSGDLTRRMVWTPIRTSSTK